MRSNDTKKLLTLYYATQIKYKVLNIIKTGLIEEYGDLLEIVDKKALNPPKDAWNHQRQQYKAELLLTVLKRLNRFNGQSNELNWILWIINEDLYMETTNFIFGVTIPNRYGILSLARLENSAYFIQKEANHEVGHLFGLKHCELPCVMTFSPSVSHAKLKTKHLCAECKKKLGIKTFKQTI